MHLRHLHADNRTLFLHPKSFSNLYAVRTRALTLKIAFLAAAAAAGPRSAGDEGEKAMVATGTRVKNLNVASGKRYGRP